MDGKFKANRSQKSRLIKLYQTSQNNLSRNNYFENRTFGLRLYAKSELIFKTRIFAVENTYLHLFTCHKAQWQSTEV